MSTFWAAVLAFSSIPNTFCKSAFNLSSLEASYSTSLPLTFSLYIFFAESRAKPFSSTLTIGEASTFGAGAEASALDAGADTLLASLDTAGAAGVAFAFYIWSPLNIRHQELSWRVRRRWLCPSLTCPFLLYELLSSPSYRRCPRPCSFASKRPLMPVRPRDPLWLLQS